MSEHVENNSKLVFPLTILKHGNLYCLRLYGPIPQGLANNFEGCVLSQWCVEWIVRESTILHPFVLATSFSAVQFDSKNMPDCNGVIVSHRLN